MKKLIAFIGTSLYFTNLNAFTNHITQCTSTTYLGSLDTYEWIHTYRTYVRFDRLFPDFATDNHSVFLNISSISLDSADEYRYEMECDFSNWDIAWKSVCHTSAGKYTTEGDELRSNRMKLFKDGEFITMLDCMKSF